MARYYKIGELARLYHLSTDTIRYYEKQGLIFPVRGANGYRLYSPENIWRLNVIRDLRGLGISVEVICQYLRNHNAASTLELLEAEEAFLESQKKKLEEMSRNLSRRKEGLFAALQEPVGVITRKKLNARPCYCIPQGYRTDEEMDVLIQKLVGGREDLYLLGNDAIGSLIDLEAAKEGRCREYEGVFVLHPEGSFFLEEGEYLCLCYRGDCSQNQQEVPRLMEYAREQGLYPQGPLVELMRTDIHISSDPQEHLTELQLRVVPDVLAGREEKGEKHEG